MRGGQASDSRLASRPARSARGLMAGAHWLGMHHRVDYLWHLTLNLSADLMGNRMRFLNRKLRVQTHGHIQQHAIPRNARAQFAHLAHPRIGGGHCGNALQQRLSRRCEERYGQRWFRWP
jgi:hypothetical protein